MRPTEGTCTASGEQTRGNTSPLGATVHRDGVNFSVYSEDSTGMELLLFDRADDGVPARVIPLDRGRHRTYHYWHVFVPRLTGGQIYAYRAHGPWAPRQGLRFDGNKVLLDPYGRGIAVPAGYDRSAACRPGDTAAVAMKSVVLDARGYDWEGDCPLKRPFSQTVIYEMHVGGFTRHPSSGVSPEKRGTFAGVIEKIPYLTELGVTAVELLPVFQFDPHDAPPGQLNYWGYAPVSFFAPHQGYSSRSGPLGPVEEFRDMVKALHRAGIEVILDVVYNHFGPEGSPAPEFGPYLTDSYMTPWGMAMNLDGAQSDHVRNYFIENALHWFERYHVDGLRLDAIHAIIDNSALPFLKSLRRKAAELAITKGRPFYLFAEDDLNDTRVVATDEHSLGLDALWCDDYHHCVHALLTGEKDGYYADFGGVQQLVKSMNEGFAYSGQYSVFRQRSFGSRSILIPKDRFIVFCQNHDQAGNRPLGERLATLVPFEALKLSAGCLLLSPYVPLIFMGEEYGEKAPFLYFVDHSSAGLMEAVREGRKKEFMGFMQGKEPPDPGAPESFSRSVISWDARSVGRGAVLLNLYRTLIRIRREVPALCPSGSVAEAWGLEKERMVFLRKEASGSSTFAVFNFNTAGTSLKMPFPEGRWVKAADSAEEAWDGAGSALPGVAEAPLDTDMSPLSFALYIREY